MKLAIYGHGGSQNHGNEAIVRGVRELFPDDELILYSFSPEVDKKFNLDKICTIKSMINTKVNYGLDKYLFDFLKKYFQRSSIYYKFWFAPFLKDISKDTIYLLEAGDQYCEKGDHRIFYSYLNNYIRRKGAKTVLMGCTINPEILKDKKVVKDVKSYSLVLARESVTYNAMRKVGLKNNLRLAPCPSFAMKSENVELPAIFQKGEVIGINFGFLAQGNEIYYANMMKNYDNVIKYILDNTKFNVALIPHVNWNHYHSDAKSMRMIYNKYISTNRIQMVNEHNASQQKYIMSKCYIIIALRTHVAIPSISAMVPTIITGYKIKSLGIHRDIYKEDMKTLVNIQNMKDHDSIINSLKWLLENYSVLQDHMHQQLPKYIKGLKIIQDRVMRLDV